MPSVAGHVSPVLTVQLRTEMSLDPIGLLGLDAGKCPVGERVPDVDLPRNVTDWIAVPIPYVSTGKVVPMVIFYVLVMIIALIGNSLVIYVIASRKALHTRTNVYVANLAISDLLVTLTCMWVHLGSNITPAWPFGDFICKSHSFFQSWAVTASVLFMTLIAGNRFFAIVFPLKAQIKRDMTAVLITIMWLLSAVIAVPHLLYNNLRGIYWKNWHQILCEDSWPRYYYSSSAGCLTQKPGKIVYVTCCIVFLYFIPIVVMAIAYTSIGVVLYQRQNRIEPNDNIRIAHQRTRKKVVRMLVAVLVGFFICWTPLQALLLWDVHRDKSQSMPDYIWTLKYVCTYMAYTNSSLNPMIYVTLSESFRTAVIQTLTLPRNKINSANIPDVRTSNVGQGKSGVFLKSQSQRPDVCLISNGHLDIPPSNLQ